MQQKSKLSPGCELDLKTPEKKYDSSEIESNFFWDVWPKKREDIPPYVVMANAITNEGVWWYMMR